LFNLLGYCLIVGDLTKIVLSVWYFVLSDKTALDSTDVLAVACKPILAREK